MARLPGRLSLRLATGLSLVTMLSFPAHAEVRDWVYVHCSGGGGDFRISELSHKVSQFSVASQGYRATCAECQVVEWGDKITLLDENGDGIKLDRVSGRVSIRQSRSAKGAAVNFDGICTRGSFVAGKPSRVF